MSALSASGLALADLASSASAYGEMPRRNDDHRSWGGYRLPEIRQDFNFNSDWEFYRPTQNGAPESAQPVSEGDVALPQNILWESITLPHSVRLEPRDVSGGRNYQGLCWYRKQFLAESEWKNRILYLNFQGAMQVADVWLNGLHLTTHYGGYIPFTVDISKAVKYGQKNVLIVRLDNSDNPQVPPGKPQADLDFVYFGGLYRSVQLQVLHPVHITNSILADKVSGGGVFVTYPVVAVAESMVQVQVDVVNETNEPSNCLVAQELIGPDERVVASSKQSVAIARGDSRTTVQKLHVRNAKLWHPEDPNLYWLHTTVSSNGQVTDDEYTRIGIRSIRFEPDHRLHINGQPYFSIGANRHQDHPYVGYALPPSAHYRDAYKLRDAGFTSYRSHYPQDISFMDACDELGILAIVSNPGWQFVGDDLFKKRAYQDAREMIRRDRNHPSILIWEAALNESDNSSLAAELYHIVHEEYPGPECYTAGDPIEKQVDGFPGWDVTYLGGEKRDTNHPSWIREWGDQVDNWSDQQGRGRVARAWGETPMMVQSLAHMNSLDSIYASEKVLSGADLWAGIDAYRGYHHQPFLGAPLDVFRLPKFDYYMFQSQRPPEPKFGKIGAGPMAFIANFASFYSPSVVTVFSNCEQVRLFQNGKIIATHGPDAGYHLPHPPFTFNVGEFSRTRSMLFASGVAPSGTEIGELRAEGLCDGKVVATHILHSPGVPDHIELKLDTCGLDPIADGADWVRVYASICDARGTTYPFGDDLITFSVSGHGTLVGDESIGANPVRAEAGIATGLIRTAKSSGLVTVRASSPGLKSTTLEFQPKLDWKPSVRYANHAD
jgi:beta-galactosidase